MLQTIINPSFPVEDFPQIEGLISRFIVMNGNPVDGTETALLKKFLLPFASANWKQDALNASQEMLRAARNNPNEVEYYLSALEELSEHLTKLKAERAEEVLTLCYTAYHLGFYECSSQKKLEEIGFFFKVGLADSVDPKTRGQGSLLGYVARLRDYIGAQLFEHKELIKQKLLSNQAMTTASPKVESNSTEKHLLEPQAAPITPLKKLKWSDDKKTTPSIAPTVEARLKRSHSCPF